MRLKMLIVEDDPLLAEAASDVPIFFITARSMEEDKLKGYMLGADDYIRKPFSLPVLYAKAMAILARVRGDNSVHTICRGGIEIHTHTHEVIIKGNPCVLAPMEYQMLVFFWKIQIAFLPESKS